MSSRVSVSCPWSRTTLSAMIRCPSSRWSRSPCFFVLSGYLFRPHPDLGQYFIDKSINLLLPYLAFLLLLHGPEWIDRPVHDGPVTLRRTLRLLVKPLAGGRRVGGPLIVF